MNNLKKRVSVNVGNSNDDDEYLLRKKIRNGVQQNNGRTIGE